MRAGAGTAREISEKELTQREAKSSPEIGKRLLYHTLTSKVKKLGVTRLKEYTRFLDTYEVFSPLPNLFYGLGMGSISLDKLPAYQYNNV